MCNVQCAKCQVQCANRGFGSTGVIGLGRYAWLELIDLFEEHGATPQVDRTSKNWKIVPSPGERIGPPESRRADSLKFGSLGPREGNVD
jgi:hypothetical protein